MTTIPGNTGNVVERQAKVEGRVGVPHIVSQSTNASVASAGQFTQDGRLMQPVEGITLLPEDSLAYEPSIFIQQLIERGYEYNWENLSGFTKSENRSLHYLRHVETDTIYVAKIEDLATHNDHPADVDPCEKAEIAEYLTELYNGNVHSNSVSVDFFRTRQSPVESNNDNVVNSSINWCVLHLPGEGSQAAPKRKNDEAKNTESQMINNNHVAIAGKENLLLQHEWFMSEDNKLVTIFENCQGGDLYSKIMQARRNGMEYFEEKYVLDVFRQLCQGVAYLHSLKLIHGDIKTSNVFFKSQAPLIVKLGDYDTCHHISTVNVKDLETIMYTAPEILLDSRVHTGYASDVWALGCLLYELLTLEHPFRNPCTYVSMRTAFCDFSTHRNRMLSCIPKKYSVYLCDILDAILQFNPKWRPSVPKILSMLNQNFL